MERLAKIILFERQNKNPKIIRKLGKSKLQLTAQTEPHG